MKIVIAGGGLTGWISAFVLSKKYPDKQFVVIDSSKDPTIGVGEGTTGYFASKFLRGEDFTVREFFEKTKATPKLGIEFNDWGRKGDSFLSPIDGSATKQCNIDFSAYFDYTQPGQLGESSLLGILRKHNRLPFKRGSADNVNGIENDFIWKDTAVHLDNECTIKFFKEKTINRENVKCIDDSIVSVVKNKKGIQKVVCENISVYGDLFLDCTGFKRLLSKNVKWISYSKYLPTNSVITFQTTENHGGSQERIEIGIDGEKVVKGYLTQVDLVTKANAMNDGWSWLIPTQERYGGGYVYCDYFTNEDKATKELLEKYPGAEIGKSFKFDSGKQKTSWNDNVISMGLAYQFLEPLQATSIHFTLVQLDLIERYCIKGTKEFTLDSNSRIKYNEHVDRVIENFKDMINMHYSGKRNDTKFWKYISKQYHLTDFTKHIIKTLRTRGLFYWDFTNEYGTTGQELWMYPLLGLNHLTKDECFGLLINSKLMQYASEEYYRLSTEASTLHNEYFYKEEFFVILDKYKNTST